MLNFVNRIHFYYYSSYSVNEGEWKTVEDNKKVTFGDTNGTLRLRGINPQGTALNNFDYSTISFTNTEVKVACEGDIRTLLDYRNYKAVNTSNARFCFLFNQCTVLTSAPELPATKLADNCYNRMFWDCTSLTSAPALPAKTLAYDCYFNMFSGCTNLTSAPELKATTLADGCYNTMFSRCTKLSTVTMLAPSDQISEKAYCCNYWLSDAGTDETVSSRTLIVTDEAAYTALKNKTDYLPTEWQIGSNCTVLDKDGNEITE